MKNKRSIHVLGTYNVELATLAIKALLGPLIQCRVKTAPYNQVFQELLNPSSTTLSNHDGYANVLLFRLSDLFKSDSRSLAEKCRTNNVYDSDLIKDNLNELIQTIQSASEQCKIPWIVCLCPENNTTIVDNTQSVFFRQLEKYIRTHLDGNNTYFISPMEITQLHPCQNFFDQTTEQLGHIPYSLNYYSLIALKVSRTIYSILMSPYKAIITDCDETLWSGLCGEEGLAGISINPQQRKLQEHLLEQVNAGMLLCMCSKNNIEDVKKVFQQHPDMILQWEDFTEIKVNWKPKSENISEIAQQLNLSLDTFIFLDDNPVECAEVSSRFPEIFTVQIPTDPIEMLSLIQNLWVFDHPRVTTEDKNRAIFYKQELKRLKFKERATSLDEFIKKLKLHVEPKKIDQDNLLRVSQLIKRCNQFNFTGDQTRETDWEKELKGKSSINLDTSYVFSVEDRFGDYGNVGVVLSKIETSTLIVELFLLSCRVLSKGVEHRIVSFLAKLAKDRKLKTLRFNFSKSEKNSPAEFFFNSLCQLPGSKLHQTNNKNQYCVIKPTEALSLSYNPTTHSSAKEKPLPSNTKTKTNKIKFKKHKALKEKLLNLAKQVSTLKGLEKLVRDYQVSTHKKSTKRTAYQAPTNPTETYLQEVFQKILHLPSVSITEDFFSLGGNSLMGTFLLSELSQHYSIHVTIDWLFRYPTIKKLAKAIENSLGKPSLQPLSIPTKSTSDKKLVPLSFAQQRIWFLDQLHPNTPLYNTFIAFHLKGPVDTAAIEKSFNTLVERHDSLRTIFSVINGVPYQTIKDKSAPTSLRILNGEDFTENEIKAMAYSVAQKPFNLLTGPLLNITLLFQKEQSYLFFSSHHILIDGHSFSILMNEFSLLYNAYTQNQEPALEPLSIQYSDYALWQTRWLQGKVFEKQKAYWLKQLAGIQELNFPTDYPRSNEMSTRGKRIPFFVDKSLLDRLRKLSQQKNVTLFTTLMSCYAILLNKYTHKKDIVIGTAVAGRQYPGVEHIVGHFVNILLLRFNLFENHSFSELLVLNHSTIIDAYKHQDLPFEEIVKGFNPQRNINENPLAQMMLIFQDESIEPNGLPNLEVKQIFSENDQLILLADYDNSKLDMTLDLQVTKNGLEGLVEYNCNLFKKETIERFIDHFYNILTSICNNSEQRCSDISPMNAAEYQKIISDWNNTGVCYPPTNTVVQLFEQKALEQPDAIALVFEHEEISYRLLNQKANQLAFYFQTKHLRPQMSVALFLDRGIDLVASILALFKIGAVYVPIATNLPNDYINYLLSDSGAQYIVTQQHHHERIAQFSDQKYLTTLTVDILTMPENHQSDQNPLLGIMPEHTACLIYTSGSTGKPKGVLLKHQGLLNTIFAQIDYLNIDSNTRVLQWASLNFDALLWEIFGALAAGASLCLVREEDILHPKRLIDIIVDKAVTLWTVTPSYLSTLPNTELPDLKTLVVAGEACPLSLAKTWGTDRRFVNAYGLTETSICSVMGNWNPDDEVLTLGKPIANTQAYVLNADGQPTPIGVAGELFIVGDGVAKGYHRLSELTQERFLFNPFNLLYVESKMLRTGDWARWLPDGRLQYVGRQDEVVSVHGIRIDLNAIANILQEHPFVSQTAVNVKTYSLSDQRIIAYLVLGTRPEQNRICALNRQHFSHWQALYENLYEENKPMTIEGWESSYTRQPIPPEEMQEWIQKTSDRLLTHPLGKVLEIGCGNGLLVEKIAPYSDEYIATDFSQHALDALKTYLATHKELKHVKTSKRIAHEFSNSDYNRYDTVILNSVVQYFPSIDYFIDVLDQCVNSATASGKIFIGDIRNLDYLEAFHSDVQFHKLKQYENSDIASFGQFITQVESRVLQDPELLISPEFFHWYAQRQPEVSHINIEVRRGIFENEMNAFRYDVILHLNKQRQPLIRKKRYRHLDWRYNELNLEKLEQELADGNLKGLLIQNVPNQRVNHAALLAECQNLPAEKSIPALPWINRYLDSHSENAIDPEMFYELGLKTQYRVYVTFSQDSPKKDLDIIFVRKNLIKNETDWLNWIAALTQRSPDFFPTDAPHTFANSPLQVILGQSISKQMRAYLSPQVPKHMIPASFILLNRLPLSPNGKVDKSLLPDPDLFITHSFHSHQGVQSNTKDEVSSILRQVFAKILNLPDHQVNDHDNFFDIGGHSLLALKLINKLQSLFNVEFSIRDLFKFATISEIAAAIKLSTAKEREQV